MSGPLAVFILMNNYFHDVATAMLAASGTIMWLILRQLEKSASPQGLEYVVRLHRRMSKIVVFSLVWLAAGAIPRIITFRNFELANAAERGCAGALIAKHIVALILAVAGAALWVRINRSVKVLAAGASRELP